jgi:TRAP-type transport system periplasmic protein
VYKLLIDNLSQGGAPEKKLYANTVCLIKNKLRGRDVVTRLINFSLVMILIIALTLCSCAPAAVTPSAPAATTQPAAPPAQVIKLTSTCYLPTAHIFTPMMDEWGKEIMKRSNGRVEITYFPGGTLLSPAKVPDGLATGIADIGLSHIGYNPGRFPESEALDLPLGYPTGWVGTYVANEFFTKYKPKEWDKITLLVASGSNTTGVFTAKKAVRKLEDFKGLTLRGAGEIADAVAALGGTPRDMPMGDVYDSMSKGTVDGVLVALETLKSFKIAEVAKYNTFCWPVGNMYTFYVAMNTDKWNALPADIKKIFNDVDQEYIDKYALAWNQINKGGTEYSKSLGNELITLSSDEAARWKAAVAPVMDKYVDKMVAKGFPAQEMKDRIAFIKDRISYWTKKEADAKIPSEFDVFK